jgi:hypothetical protein
MVLPGTRKYSHPTVPRSRSSRPGMRLTVAAQVGVPTGSGF